MLFPSVSNPDEVFIKFVESNAMQQLVTDITRPSPNIQSKGSCLDLVITNDTFALSDLAIASNFITSDHHSVSFKISIYIASYNIPSSRYDLPNADRSALNNHLLNFDWSSAFSNCQDVAAQFDMWNEKLALHLLSLLKPTVTFPDITIESTRSILENCYLKSDLNGVYIKSLKPPRR